jgi:hypothetical protein
MRRRAANHFPIRSARTADRVDLAIDAVGPDDRFLTDLEGTVEVTAAGPGEASGAPRPLPLTETAPGLYETSFRPDIEAGALLFQATLRHRGRPIADATGHVTLPYAPELLPATSPGEGTASLAAAAAASGGRVLRDPAEILDPGAQHRETRQPLRTPVLLATLLLFLLDVFARRVRLPLGGRER